MGKTRKENPTSARSISVNYETAGGHQVHDGRASTHVIDGVITDTTPFYVVLNIYSGRGDLASISDLT